MANLKISQLTANAAKIASTDRVAIAKDTGGGTFASRYVTGAEINEVLLDTSPQLGGDLDVNGFKLSSANDQDVVINPNGTGIAKIESDLHLRDTAGSTAKQINLYEGFSNGSNYVAIKAADSLSANTTYTLPTADGTNGQVLSTNGTGTLSWATAGGGLTIGTTAITSGTVGRILFEGTGNVVQESARMVFDGSKYVYDGTSVTANASTFEILGAGGQRGLWVFQDNSAKIGGNNNNFITKGTGTGQSTNNFYSNDSHFCFGGVDSSKGWVHVGANNLNPQARLDVRAQGALSTDIAFRVRNSADTFNLLSIDGVGLISGRTDGAGGFSMNYQGTANTTVQLGFQNTNPYLRVANSNAGGHAFNVYTSSDNREYLAGLIGKATLAIGANPLGGTIKPNEANTNTLYMFNGTAPTLSATDSFNLYSADIVAGNAAPHFRTENGNIIKLYRETTAVAAATLVGNAGTNITDTDTFDGYTIGQVVKALRNLGILA